MASLVSLKKAVPGVLYSGLCNPQAASGSKKPKWSTTQINEHCYHSNK